MWTGVPLCEVLNCRNNSMLTVLHFIKQDNIHKSWVTPSDITPVSSASKSDFLTSSLVIPGQCNFRCSREERMQESPRSLRTETFG